MSSRRLWAIIAVGILHALLGWALVSGLAVEVVKSITGPLETVNIEEQAPPPDEPPPPPPKLEDIPPYVPPPDVQIQTDSAPPLAITVQSATPQPQPTFVAPAPPAPVMQPPPPAAIPGTRAIPNRRNREISPDDYPDASRRAEEQGTTGIRVTVGVDGRVKDCTVVRSSSFNRLDERACQIASRRWRFTPATENGQPVESLSTVNYVWRLEEGR